MTKIHTLIAYTASTVLALCFSLSTIAQVTIGSNLLPNAGALLDLKETAGTGGTANATRGLGMPRVQLTNNTDLSDLGISGQQAEHIGLLVYHATTDVCNPYHNGLYVWDGSLWQPLTPSPKQTITTNTTGINQPNTYMADIGYAIRIPVAKAFDVWDGTSWKDNGINLLTTKTFAPTDAMTVEVTWMDGQKVLCQPTISKATADKTATINLRTAKLGNAVVSLKIAGTIVWSWHVWVTPPVNSIAFNSATWMDRNLGATSVVLNNPSSKGNHYQWGRKDPFPNKADWTDNSTEATLYKMDNSTVSIDKSFVSGATDTKDNLAKSINAPLSFIKSRASSPTHYDWYASTTQTQWDNRWGANGTKSVSDPCPEGWKVPLGTTSPWNGLVKAVAADFATNKGWTWANAGFYPATGSRLDDDGSLVAVGEAGYNWTATASSSLVKAFYYDANNVVTSGVSYRAAGFAVRCVKE